MRAEEMMKYKNWVVAGDVLNPQKFACSILKRLKSSDYTASGLKPGLTAENVYPTLKEVPFEIQVLDLCINPVAGIKIVQEAFELGIKNIFIQPGAGSREIIDFCKKNNMEVVEDCALVQLAKL